MVFYEFYDGTGDTGMLVAGMGIDRAFRREADEAKRPDERLLTVTPDQLLERSRLQEAAVGQLATRLAHEATET